MTTIWWILGLALNWAFGCMVCAVVDDVCFHGNEALDKWIKACPLPNVASLLVPSFWPVILFFAWRYNRR